ncbi:hypothetical protein IMSHALPRED_007424 [Imshaugia aleurites]|uniref:Uncharacterized protein n=1 Tax=Imshaugia aleurites TaxID=172621 RepID=A0A8H3FVQ3_9LECA|nr:hypothetical protein IMSHALPRED_007424 [Imshaugia aleurites]
MRNQHRCLPTVKIPNGGMRLEPDTSKPVIIRNQKDKARTPKQKSILDRIFLPMMARSGLPVTDQDEEGMKLRGLPPFPEEYIAWVRELQARQFFERFPESQLAPEATQWLFDEEMPRAPNLLTANLGNRSFDLPTLESVFAPLRPDRRPMDGLDCHRDWVAVVAPNLPIAHMSSTEALDAVVSNELQEVGDDVEQDAGGDVARVVGEGEGGGGAGVGNCRGRLGGGFAGLKRKADI